MSGRVAAGCTKHRAVRRYVDGYRGAVEPTHLVGVGLGKAEVSVDRRSEDIHEHEGLRYRLLGAAHVRPALSGPAVL